MAQKDELLDLLQDVYWESFLLSYAEIQKLLKKKINHNKPIGIKDWGFIKKNYLIQLKKVRQIEKMMSNQIESQEEDKKWRLTIEKNKIRSQA